MAQRLLLRRLVCPNLRKSCGSVCSPPSALLPSLNTLSWHSHKPSFIHQAGSPFSRGFCDSPACSDTFNVQNKTDFTDRVLNNKKLVLVDFHASWCGPCRVLGPRLEKLVAKQKGSVIMAKIDIDEHTDLAMEYQVTVVPTVIAMKDGCAMGKFTGVKSEDELEVFIKKLL
ncbi:thioredoxin, mitochondrial [Rhincodon typus]|uniref:thioredoxin, mitochondrial n=1 Tax=Rhincodon typus TaxID=259920 RepID=UPI0009A429A8|nr:thioredoxin, mitochondrial [Rhincodon typus]XP_048473434.1 thioredoxin, mitochondrial [Rhincodon typus]